MMSGVGFGLGGIWMMGAWMLFWVFIIAGIIWLVLAQGRAQQRPNDDGSRSALRILEDRLARGEIDTEEFRTRRAVIEGSTR